MTHGLGHPLPERLLSCVGEEITALWRAQGPREPDHAGTNEHLYLDIYPDRRKSFPSPHIASSLSVRPHIPGLRAEDPAARPLYATFGTVFNHDLTTIATVVEGVRELDVDVLVTLGPGADPAGSALSPTASTCATTSRRRRRWRERPWSHTQARALSSPRSRTGLPQLALPQAADQFLNAHAPANAGVALEISPGEITAERVRAELERCYG